MSQQLRTPARIRTVAGALVFGDINVDLLARFDAEPGWGLDNLVSELVQQCGGVGANVAVALARWGVPARLLGCTGRDAFGDFALHFLESKGVETTFIQRTDRTPTGVIFIPPHLAQEVVEKSEAIRVRDTFGKQRLAEGRYTSGEIDVHDRDAQRLRIAAMPVQHRGNPPRRP